MRKSWVSLFHFPSCFWGFLQMVCGQIESVLEKRAGIGVLHRGQRGLTGPVWGILSTARTIFAFFFFFPPLFFASSSFPMTNHTNLQKKTREPIFQLDVTLVNSYCDNFVRLFWKNVKREWLIKLFSEASEVSLWKRAERHECSANDSWEIKYLSSGFEQAIGWHDGMGNEFDTEQGSWHLHSLQRI